MSDAEYKGCTPTGHQYRVEQERQRTEHVIEVWEDETRDDPSKRVRIMTGESLYTKEMQLEDFGRPCSSVSMTVRPR